MVRMKQSSSMLINKTQVEFLMLIIFIKVSLMFKKPNLYSLKNFNLTYYENH
jgi:hypothetical protein